jgi:hypothetical protein
MKVWLITAAPHRGGSISLMPLLGPRRAFLGGSYNKGANILKAFCRLIYTRNALPDIEQVGSPGEQ